METKYITIPFDLERAKRITNKSEDGKIVTRDGRNVRIVCFDVNNEDSILALVKSKRYGVESALMYQSTGEYFQMEQNENDLMLSVPEWTTFKDGDVLSYRNGTFIFKRFDGLDRAEYYANMYDRDILAFDSAILRTDLVNHVRYATEEESNKIVDKLRESKDLKAKEYLKRFFPNHSNPSNIGKEYNFEPGQPVIGIDGRGEWRYDIFSHYKPEHKNGNYVCSGRSYSKCLPYNEQTKHLIGTSEDWEG